MNVIAKFKCDSLEKVEGDQTAMRAQPVTDGSEENKSFSRWTPAGRLELLISNETEAINFFVPGEEFYITLSKEM
jgi:hypothetical protein